MTWLVVVLAQALFTGNAPKFTEWWETPVEQARELGSDLGRRSLSGFIIRVGPAVALIAAAWCLAGAWVARHELLARFRAHPYLTEAVPTPSATRLVSAKAQSLAVCCPTVLALAGLALFPMVLAVTLNSWLGGVGAVLVAFLLPVVLLANLIALLLLLGILGWPLMPVSIAAENSDTFDALSRSYNYMFARPLRYLFFVALALFVSVLPLGAALYAFEQPFAAWPPMARLVLLFLAAGLSASVFWSLQTLVYLHMRMAVDETDAGEIARDSEPATHTESKATDKAPAEPAAAAQPAAPTSPAPPTPTSPTGQRVLTMIYIFAVFAATWVFTAWLFMRAGGDDARWIGWGFFDGFVPPTEGLFKVASTIAAIWGVAWFAGHFIVMLRRAREPAPAAATPVLTGSAKSP